MPLILHRGWSPATGWIGALWTQGVGLVVFGLVQRALQPAAATPLFLLAGGGYGVTAVFFALALPLPDAQRNEGPLAEAALASFRRIPRPRAWVRAAALLAALAPGLLGGSGIPPLVWLAGAVMAYGYVLRSQDVGLTVTRWDLLGPWIPCVLSAAHALPAFALPAALPAALLGLAATWLAQAILLRQAAARQWAALVALGKVSAADIPLDDYVSETESLVAVQRAPEGQAADPSGAVLMESGTFRVDAARMLEKLSERQLEDAGDFILAWLRCAVASEAHVVEVGPSWRTLRFEFDGRPFTPTQMGDPYRALLDSESEDAERGTQFAYGLLAALRLKPEAIWIVSGEGTQRTRTMLASPQHEATPPKDAGAGTIVEVRFTLPLGLLRPHLAAQRARSVFGHTSTRLRIRDAEAPWLFAEECQSQSVDGWTFAWRAHPRGATSRLRVYHLGVLVEELDEPLGPGPQVEAAISHPGLRLSLSQSSVVRDERFQEGVKLLHAAVSTAPWDGPRP